MIFAAHIQTPAGVEIRLFSSTRLLNDEQVEQGIKEKLLIDEVLVDWILTKRPVPIDRLNENILQHERARELIGQVCKRLHLRESIYYSKKRRQVYNDAKFCIYYILRNSTNLSLSTIGAIHNRDHTTVLSGLRRFSELIETDIDFKGVYEEILNISENIFYQ